MHILNTYTLHFVKYIWHSLYSLPAGLYSRI